MSQLPVSREARPLGQSGLHVFPIAWGMWRFAGTDIATARAKVEAVLDAGITLFDTADVYGLDNNCPFGAAEALLGDVIAANKGLRARMVLATKGGIDPGIPYDSSPAYLRRAVEASLARLKVDHIDIYQIHRPDLLAHPADTAGILMTLQAEGKIGHIGVSNHSVAQTIALQAHLPQPIATHQPELSAIATAPVFDGLLDHCMAQNIGVLAWSPLGGGRLGDSAGDAHFAVLRAKLDELAKREGVSRQAMALAFVLAHPAGIVPIIGTQTISRMTTLLDESFRISLSRQNWYDILQASIGERLP